jgi:hypothetical protein
MTQQYVFSCSFCRQFVNFPHTCLHAAVAPTPPPQPQYLLVQPTVSRPVIPVVVCQTTPVAYYGTTYPIVQMATPCVLQPLVINFASVSPVCPAHQTVHSAGPTPTSNPLPNPVAPQPEPGPVAPGPDMVVSQPGHPNAPHSVPTPVSPNTDLPVGSEPSGPSTPAPCPPPNNASKNLADALDGDDGANDGEEESTHLAPHTPNPAAEAIGHDEVVDKEPRLPTPPSTPPQQGNTPTGVGEVTEKDTAPPTPPPTPPRQGNSRTSAAQPDVNAEHTQGLHVSPVPLPDPLPPFPEPAPLPGPGHPQPDDNTLPTTPASASSPAPQSQSNPDAPAPTGPGNPSNPSPVWLQSPNNIFGVVDGHQGMRAIRTNMAMAPDARAQVLSSILARAVGQLNGLSCGTAEERNNISAPLSVIGLIPA